MQEIDLKTIENKRNLEIQKLNNYIEAGKTPDEAIVKSSIKKIRKAETLLKTNGINNFSPVKDDGTFENTIDKPNNKIESSNKTTKENKPNNLLPKKTLDFATAPETIKFGVGIKKDILKKIDVLVQISKKKKEKVNANGVVVKLLENLFENGHFNLQLQPKQESKITSYNIPKEMIKDIERISKQSKLSKSEIFNTLLEKSLSDFY